MIHLERGVADTLAGAVKAVQGFVDRACKAGVKPLWGGHHHGAGELYFEPTLMDGVAQDMEIVQKEVFGPVLTWQTWR